MSLNANWPTLCIVCQGGVGRKGVGWMGGRRRLLRVLLGRALWPWTNGFLYKIQGNQVTEKQETEEITKSTPVAASYQLKMWSQEMPENSRNHCSLAKSFMQSGNCCSRDRGLFSLGDRVKDLAYSLVAHLADAYAMSFSWDRLHTYTHPQTHTQPHTSLCKLM